MITPLGSLASVMGPLGKKFFDPGIDSPLEISGLALWLDASDETTLYDATTGGSLVAADGTVARWEDKSGNGHHATQGTLAEQPIRRAGVINSLDALDFDGSDDGLNLPIAVALPDAYSLFYVLKTTSPGTDTTQRPIFGEYVSTAQDTKNYNAFDGSRGIWFDNFPPSGAAITSGGGTYQGLVVVGNITQESTSFRSLWVNGAVIGTSTEVYGGGAPDQIGVGKRLGTFNTSQDGMLCEVLTYSRDLSSSERTKVREYLADKWGVVL